MILSDYDIPFNTSDNIVAIKRLLAPIIMINEKKIKFEYEGHVLDDNIYLGDREPQDIHINFVGDDEARFYTILNVVSMHSRVPKLIQVRQNDTIGNILANFHIIDSQLLGENGNILSRDLTVSQLELVDYMTIYVYYGEVEVRVTNPTGEDENVRLTVSHTETGATLREYISEIIRRSDIFLIITNPENTKFECILDDTKLFHYGLTPRSIIKWVPIKSMEDIIDMVDEDDLNENEGVVRVFRAYDRRNNRWIAMKEYNINFGDNKITQSKSIGNELTVFWRLQNGNVARSNRIIESYGMYLVESKFYFATELTTDSLRERVNRQRYLSDDDVKFFTRQIIDGLCYLHNLKILHRNLKCSSVLLDNEGNVKLCVLGFSKYLVGSTDDEIMNGLKGSKCGNYFWAAPESLEDSVYSVYSDVWNLGATVLEMRTGFKPYHSLKAYNASFQIMENRRLIYDRPPDIDDKKNNQFNNFVSCCTQSEPARRKLPAALLNHPYLS